MKPLHVLLACLFAAIAVSSCAWSPIPSLHLPLDGVRFLGITISTIAVSTFLASLIYEKIPDILGEYPLDELLADGGKELTKVGQGRDGSELSSAGLRTLDR